MAAPANDAAAQLEQIATSVAPTVAIPKRRGARAAAMSFRAHYRAALLPRRYDGRRHVATVLLLGIAAELALVLGVPHAFAWSHAWVVPVTLVVASFVEYWAHRGPMHHRMPLVAAVFDRHTRRHHRYFTASASRFESHRDGHAVFFPAVLLVFFGAICAALGLAVATVASTEIAAVFVATAIAYYLTYEALHFAYHCPAHWTLGRLPLVRVLAHHHRTHHARRHMNKRNFNLVLPLFDWVFGTRAARRRVAR